eukprot:1157659-Pelagomonas_calceolata.AAC.6
MGMGYAPACARANSDVERVPQWDVDICKCTCSFKWQQQLHGGRPTACMRVRKFLMVSGLHDGGVGTCKCMRTFRVHPGKVTQLPAKEKAA